MLEAQQNLVFLQTNMKPIETLTGCSRDQLQCWKILQKLYSQEVG